MADDKAKFENLAQFAQALEDLLARASDLDPDAVADELDDASISCRSEEDGEEEGEEEGTRD